MDIKSFEPDPALEEKVRQVALGRPCSEVADLNVSFIGHVGVVFMARTVEVQTIVSPQVSRADDQQPRRRSGVIGREHGTERVSTSAVGVDRPVNTSRTPGPRVVP